MLNLAHATNHRGQEGMIQQMRGRIWWNGMNGDAKELIRTCEHAKKMPDPTDRIKLKYHTKTCLTNTPDIWSMWTFASTGGGTTLWWWTESLGTSGQSRHQTRGLRRQSK